MKKVVFILGPTAVGKSNFAINLAKKFDGEIISADSVQVFRGLDIGSAKEKDFCGVTHYGIDIKNPDENFSVFEFVQYTKEKIDQIISHKKLPIVVGGTALYVKALTLGYNFGDANKDENRRAELEKKSCEELFEILKTEDFSAAKEIDFHNKTRLVRAIEIAENHGKKQTSNVDILPLVVALTRNRENLYASINARVDKMIENGLVQEVKNLQKQGLNKNHQSMRAIGYKEVLEFLEGGITESEMIEKIKQHTRNYAKRQMTFLRGMNCTYVDVENKQQAMEKLEKLIKGFLENERN